MSSIRLHAPAVFGLLGSLFLATACASNPHSGAAAMTPREHTVTVSVDRPAHIADEGLTLELLEVKDSRCPPAVQCVWAGYAEAMLRVSKQGDEPATLSIGKVGIGKAGPSGSTDGSYGAYRLTLQGVTPPNSHTDAVPQAAYRVTVKVIKP
jgi:hypothetical protein